MHARIYLIKASAPTAGHSWVHLLLLRAFSPHRSPPPPPLRLRLPAPATRALWDACDLYPRLLHLVLVHALCVKWEGGGEGRGEFSHHGTLCIHEDYLLTEHPYSIILARHRVPRVQRDARAPLGKPTAHDDGAPSTGKNRN